MAATDPVSLRRGSSFASTRPPSKAAENKGDALASGISHASSAVAEASGICHVETVHYKLVIFKILAKGHVGYLAKISTK